MYNIILQGMKFMKEINVLRIIAKNINDIRIKKKYFITGIS